MLTISATVVTPLHWMRSALFLTFRPCLPRAAGQNCMMMDRALDLALPAPIWYLNPQLFGLQEPLVHLLNPQMLLINFLNGWVSMAFHNTGIGLVMEEFKMLIAGGKGASSFIHTVVHL